MPNKAAKKRKRIPEPETAQPLRVTAVTHSESSTSLSSASSAISKASATSSRCSFAPLVKTEDRNGSGRVRIAVGGTCSRN